MNTIKTLALALLIVLGAFAVKAQENTDEIPEPKMLFIRSGILCDTEEDIKIFLTKTSLNGGNFVEDHDTSCGRFVPRSPIPMMVTPTEWYILPDVRVLIAHFVTVDMMWEQYGYIAVVQTSEPRPPEKGT